MSDRRLDCLFVQPHSRCLYQGLRGKFSAIEPPTWSLLLAQSIRSVGFGAAILDCDVMDLTDEQAIQQIKEHNPRLVCFVVYGSEPNQGTARMSGAVPLAQRLRKSYPEYPICFCGTHTQALPSEVLSLSCVDCVLLNEGAYALRNLLSLDLPNLYDDASGVKGIGFKDPSDGRPYLNEPERIVSQERMDVDLPGYAIDLIPSLYSYRSHFWHGEYQHDLRSPFAAIYTSLGCPHKCSFCNINLINRTDNTPDTTSADSSIFRHWSPKHTLGVIEKLANCGVRTLRFSDEMFFLKKSHYQPLLEGIRDRWGDSLHLWSYSRVDTVKRDLLDLFRNAGVRWLCLGIESGNKKIRREVSKGSYEEVDVRRVVKEVEEAGIEVIANYIFGLPHDTKETMQETYDLSVELNTSMWNAYAAMALPGTPLFQEAKKNGWKPPDSYSAYGFLSYDSTPLGTDSLTPAEVLAFRDEAFQNYWSRPEFQSKIESKFGPGAKANIQNMLKVQLQRKLLGDSPPELRI